MCKYSDTKIAVLVIAFSKTHFWNWISGQKETLNADVE